MKSITSLLSLFFFLGFSSTSIAQEKPDNSVTKPKTVVSPDRAKDAPPTSNDTGKDVKVVPEKNSPERSKKSSGVPQKTERISINEEGDSKEPKTKSVKPETGVKPKTQDKKPE
jgi:hypothetical protein